MEGGVHYAVSLVSAHEELRRSPPELLARLYEPFYFDRQRESVGIVCVDLNTISSTTRSVPMVRETGFLSVSGRIWG